jgi:hypothetical protein
MIPKELMFLKQICLMESFRMKLHHSHPHPKIFDDVLFNYFSEGGGVTIFSIFLAIKHMANSAMHSPAFVGANGPKGCPKRVLECPEQVLGCPKSEHKF